jgi:hypothetical protein
MQPTARRNSFRFGIGDLLWLMVVAALATGWAVERSRREAQRARETAEMRAAFAASQTRLAEAEDLLEFEGVVFGDGTTIHTTPERAAQLRAERAGKLPHR